MSFARGESETIALARELQANFFILDLQVIVSNYFYIYLIACLSPSENALAGVRREEEKVF